MRIRSRLANFSRVATTCKQCSLHRATNVPSFRNDSLRLRARRMGWSQVVVNAAATGLVLVAHAWRNCLTDNESPCAIASSTTIRQDPCRQHSRCAPMRVWIETNRRLKTPCGSQDSDAVARPLAPHGASLLCRVNDPCRSSPQRSSSACTSMPLGCTARANHNRCAYNSQMEIIARAWLQASCMIATLENETRPCTDTSRSHAMPTRGMHHHDHVF